MAVVPRPWHASVHASAQPIATTPLVYASTDVRERAGNLLPLIASLLLASAVFLAPWHPVSAAVYGALVIAFYTYWVVRSYGVAIASLVGLRRIRHWERTDWRAKYDRWASTQPNAEAWDWPRHLVVIPNYKEAEGELRRTIGSLAQQPNAQRLVVVLAMEAREAGCEGKAARLLLAFRDSFADIFATYHPADIPGETPGKGSNEAWGLREAYRRLIAAGGDDVRRYTVTSCDADSVFAPHHFTVLNYLFLAEPDRYRTFWQPSIFNSNNIWDVPAGPRMLDGLSGVNRLANLVLPGTLKIPTSCYSLSWQMLHEVDYWDEEVIPEDWHLFLKCSYTLGDRVRVAPMFVRLGNDCVLTDSAWKTMSAHYFQSVRHAWGASDIPYAWRATWRHGPLSWGRKLLIALTLTKVHVLWASQWFLITVGTALPAVFAGSFGAPMPAWFTESSVYVPALVVRFDVLLGGAELAAGERIVDWLMFSNVPGALISLCMAPLVVLVAVEYAQRGPRPAHVSGLAAARSFLVWPLLAPATLFFAALPALHAQYRLASGAGLVYRVAEKGTREEAHVRDHDGERAAVPAVPSPASRAAAPRAAYRPAETAALVESLFS